MGLRASFNVVAVLAQLLQLSTLPQCGGPVRPTAGVSAAAAGGWICMQPRTAAAVAAGPTACWRAHVQSAAARPCLTGAAIPSASTSPLQLVPPG